MLLKCKRKAWASSLMMKREAMPRRDAFDRAGRVL